MPFALSSDAISRLAAGGVTMNLKPGTRLPDESIFEPPCSLKWMEVQHSLHLGAFSYGVSGYYYGCRIGRYCSFGEEVQIGRHPHPMAWASTSPFFYERIEGILDQPLPAGVALSPAADFRRSTPPAVATLTHIGHDVWIGHGAFVLPGVHIGNGAVIAAMSVVTKDVPPYAVVAGSPATIKRMRFDDATIEALQASCWWDYAPWQLKGLTVDEPLAFANAVSALRARGLQPWQPEKLNAATVATSAQHPTPPKPSLWQKIWKKAGSR